MGCTRMNLTENRSPSFEMLSEDQKEAIYNGMIKTLNTTGANVHHEGARELLDSHGCDVDGIRGGTTARDVARTGAGRHRATSPGRR